MQCKLSVDRLLSVLRDPAAVADLDLPHWDALVRVARSGGLLGRLAWLIQREGVWDQVPEQPRAHLRWSLILADACAREVRHESRLIARALAQAGLPAVLLKGAAYVCGDYDAAGGRFFRDIDILVPGRAIDDVELALMRHGWMPQAMNAYDQRYYREWMHEIPPMRHNQRGTVLDVHFNILPRVGRLRPDPERLMAAATPPPSGEPMLGILSLPDLILHSSAHLFQNGEFDDGLRDLSDLDLLIRQWLQGRPEPRWPYLVERAVALDLAGPLYLALVLVSRLQATPVPPAVIDEVGAAAPQGPAMRNVLRVAFQRALIPAHPLVDSRAAALARAVLFIRSHWIRMPPLMLVRHLGRKWLRQRAEARA